MKLLRLLFGSRATWQNRDSTENQNPSVEVPLLISREGKSQRASEAWKAWSSGSLKEMLGAMDKPCHPVDRHFLLQTIVRETYKLRKKDPAMRDLCERVALQHLAEFPEIAEPLRREMGGLPRVVTFQNLATILAERGEFDRAISVCQTALAYGLHDSTKGGFEGRIAALKKKSGSSS